MKDSLAQIYIYAPFLRIKPDLLVRNAFVFAIFSVGLYEEE